MPKLTKTLIKDKTIGVVGIPNTSYGELQLSDIGAAPTTANTSIYRLDNDDGATILDDGGGGRGLTKVGTPSFNSKGFFNKESIIYFDGATESLVSTNAYFNVGSTFSMGCWVNAPYAGSGGLVFMSVCDNENDRVLLRVLNNQLVCEGHDGATREVNSRVAMLPNKWYHVAVVIGVGVLRMYVNGVRAGSFTGFGTQSNITTPVFRISGRRNSLITNHRGSITDAFVTKQTLTDEEVLKIYQKRFNGPQLSSGHILNSASFPFDNLAGKVAFWNLNNTTTNTDGSGNSLTLNYTGTVNSAVANYTGLNINGGQGSATLNGTSHRLARTDSFFNTLGEPYTMGGWFNCDNWASGSNPIMFALGNGNDSTDPFQIITFSDGTGFLYRIGTGSTNLDTNVTTDQLVNGKWIHFVFKYDGLAVYGYINGNLIVRNQLSAIPNTGAITNLFSIGARRDANGFLACRIQDCFFVRNTALSDQDIKKLYSARIDLTGSVANTPVQSRSFELITQDESGHAISPVDGWLVDQSQDKLYVDLGAGEDGEKVTLKVKG
jgi:hypothetical protein